MSVSFEPKWLLEWNFIAPSGGNPQTVPALEPHGTNAAWRCLPHPWPHHPQAPPQPSVGTIFRNISRKRYSQLKVDRACYNLVMITCSQRSAVKARRCDSLAAYQCRRVRLEIAACTRKSIVLPIFNLQWGCKALYTSNPCDVESFVRTQIHNLAIKEIQALKSTHANWSECQ